MKVIDSTKLKEMFIGGCKNLQLHKAEVDANGDVVDVAIDYSEDYVSQMLRYSHDYSPLTK